MRHLIVCVFSFGVFAMPFASYAQIETIENGGIVDKNTQKDNENDDETDLDKNKYSPENLSAVLQSDGNVSLEWKDNAKDEDGYKVERQSSGGSWRSIADLGKSAEQFIDRSTKADTTYTYRIRAYNTASETDYTNSNAVTTPEPGAEELLGYDVVQAEIERAVKDSVQEKEEQITDLEQQLRIANEDLVETTETIEQTSACSIETIPEEEIDRVVQERCERIPGADAVEKVAGKTTSLFSQVLGSTKGRLILSSLVLFGVLNNVLWHITHRSVRKKLHHHRGEHHRLRDLLHLNKK